MRICIINGSPKGKNSVTLQTSLYLRKLYPDCEWAVIHAGQRIRAYEKDFSRARRVMERADVILFSYPVYTFLAPWQLHRFIELMKGQGVSLRGKYATQITTSKHFYDVTAHRYIEQNCQDMGMKYIRGLSADMGDLVKQSGQDEARAFWDFVRYSVAHGLYEHADGAPRENGLGESVSACMPEGDGSQENTGKRTDKRVVLLHNAQDGDDALLGKIAAFQRIFPYRIEVENIAKYPFAGGCLGCLQCAGDGKCIYKDGFPDFLREKVQTADAILYAFSIKDHSMGASFKLYDDRQFCNGHRTMTIGTPVGYLVEGDYGREDNLHTIIEARAQVGHNYLAGVAEDAAGMEMLSAKLCYAMEQGYVPPQNFYGVGGMKIFRDLIYVMRGFMKADHAFYKKHGFYDDLPGRQVGTILGMSLVGAMMANPKLKAKAGSQMSAGMLAPYRKVIRKASYRMARTVSQAKLR